jgi:hypothetical protein
MAETRCDCNGNFVRRCAVLFRLFKKRRGLQRSRSKINRFYWFPVAGTRVASSMTIFNSLAD